MKHTINPWERGVIVRHWDEEDGPAMAEVHKRAILSTSNEFYSKAQRESWAHGLDGKGYAKSAANGEKFLIAVNEDDKPVAFCGYKQNEICGLYVDPQHQGTGVGNRLALRAIGNQLQDQPEKLIVDSSAPAVGFYEKLGFSIVKEVTHDTRGGVKLHAFDMESETLSYSDTIAPHDGRELQLMLQGKKRLAWFNEMDPIDAFEPYVEEGKILRYVWHDWTKHLYEQMRDEFPDNIVWPEPVFYYLPDEQDRMTALMDELASQLVKDGPQIDLASEARIGKLLDYSHQSIDAYLELMRSSAANGELTILDN